MKRLANIGDAHPAGCEMAAIPDDKSRPELTPNRAAATIEALASAVVAAESNVWNLNRTVNNLLERATNAERWRALNSHAIDKIYDLVGGVSDKTPMTPEATLDAIVAKVGALVRKKRRKR